MLSNQNAMNDLDAMIGNSCSPTCAMVRVPSPSADLRSARLPTTDSDAKAATLSNLKSATVPI
jgi:hypothetical protein